MAETKKKAPAKKTEAIIDGEHIAFKDVDPHTLVNVYNGFQGNLIYVSKRSGEKYVWKEFGDYLEMELLELRNAKSSSNKSFFINNWFMFDEDWIPEYLGVAQFYKNAVPIDEFDNLFRLPPAKLKETIEKMSDGQKDSLRYKAVQLIDAHAIDSMKTVDLLRDLLHIHSTG